MDSQKPVYLTSFGGGLVLSHKNINNPKTAVVQFLDPKKDEQKWLVEYGEGEGIIALKSVANGQYLRPNGNRNGSPVGTGERAWWKMSWWLPVKHPFAFQLTSVDYPNVLLNHFQGKAYDNTLVHMWRFEQPWCHGFSWSFMNADLSFCWPGGGSAQSKVSEEQVKDLEQREAALAQAQKDVEAQKAEQEKTLKDVAAQKAELEKAQKELAARKAEQEKAEQQLKNELKQQAGAGSNSKEDVDDRNKELQEKLDELRSAERDITSREAAADKQRQQNDAKAKDLDAKEKDVQKREAQLGQSTGTTGGASEADLLRSENKNLKLQLKVRDLEAEIARLKNSKAQGSGLGSGLGSGSGLGAGSGAGSKTNTTPNSTPAPAPSKDGTAKTANMSKPRVNFVNGKEAANGEEAGAIGFDCGHVVYPPPRKLRRKMIGMLYD